MENATILFDNYSKEELLDLLQNQAKVVSILESEINRLGSETNRLESETNRLESETNRLESETNKLESKTNKLESKTNKLEFKAEKLESEKTKLEQEVSYLKFQIEQFKRAMYGSKKERFVASGNPEQLAIPFEVDEHEIVAAIESVKEQITYQREKAKSKHQGRMALPSHLAVNEIILEPTENIEGMKCIGQEITD
jgi:transposase